MINTKYFQSGQAALVAVIIISSVAMAITLGAGLVSIVNQRINRNIVQSARAYYVAEAGIEDSLLRIIDLDLDYQTSNTLTIGSDTATITINQTGQELTVTSEGDAASRNRNVSTTLKKNTTGASFFYGVQVGEGGLIIDHNDGQVIGNVYADGTSYGSGEVTGSITVAGDGNELQDLDIGEDAFVYSCADANITGNLTYNDAGSNSCTVGGTAQTQPDSFDPIDFPIDDATIASWKSDAELGGVLTGDQTITTDQILGPVKIDGNLYIDNNVNVTLNGNVWITGTFDSGNNAIIEVDEGYGTDSGIFLIDGNAQLRNNVIMRGTSDPDSFLIVVGTSPSQDEGDAAMDVKNNLDGAILFTPNGIMVLHNNVDVVEAMAHKLLIKKATVTYESGLENINFSSGPAGGWDVRSWFEVE